MWSKSLVSITRGRSEVWCRWYARLRIYYALKESKDLLIIALRLLDSELNDLILDDPKGIIALVLLFQRKCDFFILGV